MADKQYVILSDLLKQVKQLDETDPEAYHKYELLLKIERGNPKDDRLLEYIAENKAAEIGADMKQLEGLKGLKKK